MKNRLLILCLVLVLCALSFAACGQKDTTTTTGKNPPSTSSSSTTATTTTTTLPAPDLTCYHTGSTAKPSCTESAECSECGETLDALDHVYMLPGVHTNGNCQTKGFSTSACLRCGVAYTEEDASFGLHHYVNGTCSVCGTPEGKLLIEATEADEIVLPDKYNTGAGSLGYENETIVKVTSSGYYNGFYVSGSVGGSYRVSLAGLDPVNNKVVISNLDFTAGKFVGFSGFSATSRTVVYFENCIFGVVQYGRTGTPDGLITYFDHCTLENFNGSNAIFDWCEFGGNDDTDAMNPFQNVTVKNCYVANKDAVGYNRELHADATQIYGYGPNGKETIAKDQYYFNFRAEMPSVWYTDSLSYTNSILMISLDYNDADNITFEHCVVNGGGCPLMIFDNPKGGVKFKMTNILYKDIYHGVVKQYGSTVKGLKHPESSVTMENIVETSSLLVGSVWRENGQTHFSVTNDTDETRQFTVMTDKGTYTFEVKACPVFVELERDQAFSEFPFDIKYTIPEDATWAVCYDSTNGNYQQIRFYNPENQTVYLDEGRLESWSAASELYEIDHGRMGSDIYWILMSDGTLTISLTNNEQGPGNRSKTVNTPQKDYNIYKDLIRHIKVMPGITSIAGNAFQNYYALESVSLPSTIQKIDSQAFRNCYTLKTINIPYGIKSIGRSTFENCVSLESVTVPSTVTTLGNAVFRGCASLREVVLAANVSTLPNSLFGNCYHLKTVWLSGSIKEFGAAVFENCYSFDTLYFEGREEDIPKIKGGTLLSKASITYITDADFASKEDRELASREPKAPAVGLSISTKIYDGEPISYRFTTNSDGEVTFKWMRSSVIIDGAPTEVGRYYLVVKITATENYQAFIGHYSFFINQASGRVTLKTQNLDKVYDGIAVGDPTFTVQSDATPTIIWKSGDAICASAPSLPGVYTVTVSVPATENYTASSATMTVRITDENGICWDGSTASAFAGGNGTEQNPYLIANGSQLSYLASLINNTATYNTYATAYYKLTADVFLNDSASSYASWMTTAPAQKWIPIGVDSATAFKGHFDGNGHTIYGLYAAYDSSNNFTGFFGYLNGATVENISFNACAVVSAGGTSTYTGTVAGMAVDSAFRDVRVEDCVVYAQFQSGGMVGGIKCTNDDVRFENCHVNVKVYHTNNAARLQGGFVGHMANSTAGKRAYFNDCTVRGEITAMDKNAAGFIAEMAADTSAIFTNCINYATVTVQRNNSASGFVTTVKLTKSTSTVQFINCMNFGAVTANGSYASGFVSLANVTTAGTLRIENVANYGAIAANANYAGGIIGQVSGESVAPTPIVMQNAVCAGEAQALQYYGAVIGGTTAAHTPMQLENVYYASNLPAISIGSLSGAVAVQLNFNATVEWLNTKASASEGYLLWTMGEGGPKFVSALRMDSTSLDRYENGAPLAAPLYTVLAGDGKVTVSWYKNGTLLASAPSAAGDYVVVVTVNATSAFAESSVRLDVTVTAQGGSVLRVNDPSKVYDGTPVANPAINTTNEGATVTYTYYKGVYGAGELLAGAPTDAGTYYVVVRVEAIGSYAAIEKYKAFEITVAPGEFSSVFVADREYNGMPLSIEGYTYNGTAAVTVTYFKGTYLHRYEQLSSAPSAIGQYVVILSAAPEANFSGAQTYCEFKILPIASTVTLGASLTKQYDGNPVSAPQYLATNSGGAITVTYKDAEGNVLASAPSAPGNYSVTVSLAANGNYGGASATEHFEIWQSGNVWTGGVSASFAGGTGTEADPFLIATPEQLAHLSQVVNVAKRYSISGTVVVEGNDYAYNTAYYKLTADLQMNANSAGYASWATYASAVANWIIHAPANVFTPIGNTSSYNFAGTFDGAGHTIKGLFVNTASAGLFGEGRNCTVKNLKIEESVFLCTTNSQHAGSIVGAVDGGTFEDCAVKNVSVFSAGSAGGIAGSAGKNTGVYNYFTRVSFEGTVGAVGMYAAGIVGRIETHSGIVCATSVTVRGSVVSNSYAGGIVGGCGSNPRIILFDCSNYASVTSKNSTAGGIVGYIHYTTGGIYVTEMTNVKNYGAVTAGTYAGGIIGDRTLSKTGYVTLRNVLNAGAVKTTGTDASKVAAGGIFGHGCTSSFIKMYNCVSLTMAEGVNAGSVIGYASLQDGAAYRLVCENVYGLGQVVGTKSATVEIPASAMNVLTSAADASALAALNAAVTAENGYKAWSVADGKLTF